MRAQSVWQVEVNKLKVAQLDELLSAKGVKRRGLKAEKAMEVAWRYTKKEIADWRAKQQETLTPPALLSTPRPPSKGSLEKPYYHHVVAALHQDDYSESKVQRGVSLERTLEPPKLRGSA